MAALWLWHSPGMSDDDKIRQLPCWNGPIDISPLSGGLSNANYRVADGNGTHVVRLGQDYPFHHVFRERETMVARAAHAAGFAPTVEYAETGVLVTAYINAQPLTAMDVKVNPKRIGELLRNFHSAMPAHVSGPGFMFWPAHVIRDYIITLKANAWQDTSFLGRAGLESQAFEAAQLPMPIVFGHHDMLPANILDDGTKLWLIDFEYAGFGTAMFDLAGTASNALMHADEKALLLQAYFGAAPRPEMQKAFAAMECASLLRETLWAMVSSLFLAAPGVDYNAYTTENRTRYIQALDAYQNIYGKISI